MKIIIVLIFSLSFLSIESQATDWNQTRSQLELLQKALEEKSRAKREGRKMDLQRLQREADQIQADKQRRYEQKQAQKRREAEQQRAARERAYRNSAQYKHNQKLQKAIKNDRTYGYGGSGSSAVRSNSTRYRPPQQTTPGYQKPTSTARSLRPSYSKPRNNAKPTGITTNTARSNYQPTVAYDADSLDASGIGLHEVPSPASSTRPSSGSGYAGGPSPGKCLEWVEVAPYQCGVYGIDTSTCTSRCVRYEWK